MALTIYPTTDYDSFISVADATTTISEMTLHASLWDGITETEREIYLRIACRVIEDGIDQTVNPYPDPMPDCAGEAQALMAVQDLVYGFSASTATSSVGAIKKQKVSSLEIEYYDSDSDSPKKVSYIPSLAVPCLELLGFDVPPNINGLTQLTLGKS